MKDWQQWVRLLAAVVVVTVIALSACGFIVQQEQVAVLTHFGKPVKTTLEPGLYWRWPYPIERVYRFDKRIRTYDTPYSESLTKDKKNVVVMTYVAWRVADPVLFLQAMGTVEKAENALDGLVTDAKYTVLGNYELDALVSTTRGDIKVNEIEANILKEVASEAKQKYGIDVRQVGFKRMMFPEENVKYVFDQMRAERAQFAAQFRAEGEREAADIRAQADLQKATILAKAEEESDKIRGNADAEAARIYAEAHAKDPEFYAFLRSLDSLKKILGKKSTIVLKTDSAPFAVLRDMDSPLGLKSEPPKPKKKEGRK